jgi:hypothetical protein
MTTRPPAVAGTFYPSDRGALEGMLASFLAPRGRAAKAILAPHAGYVYSGPIAGSAFAHLAPDVERVVLIGPSHRVRVQGLVAPGASKLETPLGELEVDMGALRSVGVADHPLAHAREHSLEVELPFIQKIAPRAKIVPLAVGLASPQEVGRVLESLWGGPETAIVISSDLSHYLPYCEGRRLDEATCERIASFHMVDGYQACGAAGVNGLSWLAAKKRLRAELLDLRSSGDTAGTRAEVVGYGAFAFYEEGT